MCAAAGQGATADRAKAGRELRLISALRLVELRLVASSRSSLGWPKGYQPRLELPLPPFGCVIVLPGEALFVQLCWAEICTHGHDGALSCPSYIAGNKDLHCDLAVGGGSLQLNCPVIRQRGH